LANLETRFRVNCEGRRRIVETGNYWPVGMLADRLGYSLSC
jgi:hypothetical protein